MDHFRSPLLFDQTLSNVVLSFWSTVKTYFPDDFSPPGCGDATSTTETKNKRLDPKENKVGSEGIRVEPSDI